MAIYTTFWAVDLRWRESVLRIDATLRLRLAMTAGGLFWHNLKNRFNFQRFLEKPLNLNFALFSRYEKFFGKFGI